MLRVRCVRTLTLWSWISLVSWRALEKCWPASPFGSSIRLKSLAYSGPAFFLCPAPLVLAVSTDRILLSANVKKQRAVLSPHSKHRVHSERTRVNLLCDSPQDAREIGNLEEESGLNVFALRRPSRCTHDREPRRGKAFDFVCSATGLKMHTK